MEEGRRGARVAGVGLDGRHLAILLAAAVAGCGDGPGPAPAVVIRDSANIVIVENAAGSTLEAPVWRIGAEPSVEIGSDPILVEAQLHDVSGAARLSDGRIALVNAGSSEVRVFDEGGRFVAAAGREGQGPGEFLAMSLLGVLPGDSILIWDVRNARFSVMSPEPRFARAFSPGQELSSGTLAAVGLLSGGWPVMQGPLIRDAARPVSGTVVRADRALLILGSEGGLAATLDTFPSDAMYLEIAEGIRFTSVPLADGPRLAVGGGQIWAGTGERYEILGFGRAGLERIIRLERETRPLTPAVIDQIVEARLAEADDQARPGLRRTYERMTFPDIIPAYRTIVVDRANYVWVEETTVGTVAHRTWTIFDPRGRVAGQTELPADFQVYDIGPDWILGQRLTELDVPIIVLHDLVRPT